MCWPYARSFSEAGWARDAAIEEMGEDPVEVDRRQSEGKLRAEGFGLQYSAYFPPGVLTGVDPDSIVAKQELFGPIATVYKVSGEDAAVELANDTPFGLGSYVFTTDPEQARRVADKIEAGMVFVNEVTGTAPDLPFGGVKRSGVGRELGPFGIEEFANKKLIHTPKKK